ncbi:unnamed protein product [Coregonus sp. 'balchen']|nr:unnamed protein product [Coregonus sp. 'balchen']
MSNKLLVKNAKQVVLICNNGEKFLTKDGMQRLCVIENSSLVIGSDGLIKDIGPASTIDFQYAGVSFDKVIDATGMLEHTRAALASTLLASLTGRLGRMQRAGTTLVECKSGYGLELQTELKMLEVIETARRTLPINISSTYWVRLLPRRQQTSFRSSCHSCVSVCQLGALRVDNIDVFCEQGVFDLASTCSILQAGLDMGLNINFHGDELHPMNSAQLGAELGALAISHLEEVTDEGIAAMATAKTAAVLLPTTAYILRLPQPRARDMLDAGVIVALGSDFNPNAYCCSMPVVMHLACVNMRMSMPEALAAATINAAYALGCSHTHGSLEVNKHADLLVLNAPRWEHLIYQLGGHQELIRYVVIRGNVVYNNDKTMDF